MLSDGVQRVQANRLELFVECTESEVPVVHLERPDLVETTLLEVRPEFPPPIPEDPHPSHRQWSPPLPHPNFLLPPAAPPKSKKWRVMILFSSGISYSIDWSVGRKVNWEKLRRRMRMH